MNTNINLTSRKVVPVCMKISGGNLIFRAPVSESSFFSCVSVFLRFCVSMCLCQVVEGFSFGENKRIIWMLTEGIFQPVFQGFLFQPVGMDTDRDQRDCPVCLSTFETPVTMPCGHTFCRQCILDHKTSRNHWCPLCRAKLPGKADILALKPTILLSDSAKAKEEKTEYVGTKACTHFSLQNCHPFNFSFQSHSWPLGNLSWWFRWTNSLLPQQHRPVTWGLDAILAFTIMWWNNEPYSDTSWDFANQDLLHVWHNIFILCV